MEMVQVSESAFADDIVIMASSEINLAFIESKQLSWWGQLQRKSVTRQVKK